MKNKGQRGNRSPIETLACLLIGREGWSRDFLLEAARRGSIPPTSNH